MALGAVLGPDGSRARDRRQLARRDRRDRRPARRRAPVRRRAAPRAKGGLGPAYLAGFRHALERGAELVLEMDCDFSHDPTDVPRLLAAAAEADLVLGSRYVPGGGRRELGPGAPRSSRPGGSLYARVLLGVRVRDLTGGFKCFRRAVLEAIDLDAVLCERLRLPDRDDLPREASRLPRPRGADHVRRPRVGGSKMTGAIVLGGDLEGAAAPARALCRQRL